MGGGCLLLIRNVFCWNLVLMVLLFNKVVDFFDKLNSFFFVKFFFSFFRFFCVGRGEVVVEFWGFVLIDVVWVVVWNLNCLYLWKVVGLGYSFKSDVSVVFFFFGVIFRWFF